MKKESILLIKRVVSISSIVGLAAGATGLLAYGIVQATKDNKFSKYPGNNTRKKTDVQWDDQHKSIVNIRSIAMDFGSKNIIHVDPSPFNRAVNSKDENAKNEFSKKIWKIFYENRKKTGINPTIIVKTPVFTFKNNYFDLFDWTNTFDVIDYFTNEVMWGPEVGALTEFSIVRGINKNGSQVILGGHSGDRDKRQIKFYPDSFFGGQDIYRTNRDGLFVDIKYMPVSQNGIIKKLFIEHAFNSLFSNGKMKNLLSNNNYAKVANTRKTFSVIDKNGENKTLTSDTLFKYETDESIKNILSIKNYENYIESFVAKKNASFDKDIILSPGNRSKPVNTQLAPGNFYSFSEFDTFIKSRSELKPIDILVESDGTKRVVYPYRYLRILFLKTFTIFGGEASAFAAANKLDEQSDLRYKNFVKDPSNPEEGIPNFDNDENTGMFLNPLKTYQFKDGGQTFDISNVSFWSSFDNFADDFSEDIVHTIAKIYNAAIGIDTSNIIKSANVTHNGKNKQRIIIEKYYGLVDKIKQQKEKDGWSPMEFNDEGKPSIGSFLPNLYLWHMEKQVGLKDYLESKGLTTSLTRQQLDAYDKSSRDAIANFGINWLKYVTSHEYGHHMTLNYIKDLSEGILPPSGTPSTEEAAGIYKTGDEVYLGGTQASHGYHDTFDRQLVNAFLRTLTGGGFAGEYALRPGEVRQLSQAMMTQLSKQTTKERPDFDILDEHGHVYQQGGEFNDDESPETFKDFASSWRGFRKFDELLKAIPTAMIQRWRHDNPGDPTSYPLLALLLNSWDESSYSLDPSMVLPVVPFSRGDGTPGSDEHLINPDDPKNFARVMSSFISGWDKIGEDRGNVIPKVDMTTLHARRQNEASDKIYDHEIVDASGTLIPGKFALDQIPKGTESDYFAFMSYLDGSRLIKSVDDLKYKDGSSFKEMASYSAGEQQGKNDEYEVFAPGTSSDIRNATSFKLDVYKDLSENKYYLESGNGHTVKSTITVDSAVYENLKFVGITRVAILKGLYLNDGKRDRKDRYDQIIKMTDTNAALTEIKKDIVDELNDDTLVGQRRVLLSKTMVNSATMKEQFVKWFSDGYGLYGTTVHQNNEWKKSKAESIFITYWRMLGRTKQFSIEPDAFQPTTNIMMFVIGERLNTSELSEVYSTYLDTGAYARYGQIFADYLFNLPEILTRSVQQLAYSPSKESLGSNPRYPGDHNHDFSEYYDGVTFMLPPVFWHLWTKDGQIGPVSRTGGWSEEKQDFIYYRTSSAFFQDFQIRHQGDSELYTQDADGSMSINRLGKSLVNYLRDSQGIREDQDISGTYMKEGTGFGYVYGYMNKDDSEKYKYIAFRNPNTGEVKYLPVHYGYANEFFNTKFGQRDSRVSLLNHYYDEKGDLQTTAEQVGWRSDDFLVKGYANAFLEAGVDYEMYFTTEQNMDNKRSVRTGSKVVTHETNGVYSVERMHRKIIINNGYDYYSGTMIIRKEAANSVATFTIRNGSK